MVDLDSIPCSPEDLDRYEVEHLFHSWSFQPTQSPPRVVSARGCRFTLEGGRELLDFSSCFVSHNVGHQDPRVVAAIREQAEALCSFAPSMSTRPRALLAKMLAEVTPGDLSRSFLSLGGTEANEAALKIARAVTGRRKLITRWRTYHGGTAAPLSVSAGDSRGWAQDAGPFEAVRVPQPYCYRCMFGLEYPSCDLRCATYVDEVLALEGGGETVAAMIVEPVTGANGVIVPPPEYFPEIRAICDRHGVLLIADEVMSGFGRTGRWFALDHWGVTPDILSMAKGLTGAAVPLGATIVREALGDHFKEHFFNHGATYAGHALACAAAIRVIRIYQEDGLIERSAELGEVLLEGARALAERHPSVGDVRGLGLFVGLELVKSRETREPLVAVADKVKWGSNPKLEVAKRLFELGMIAMGANPGNVIALAPPLCVERDDIEEGLALVDEALAVADGYCDA